MPRNIDDASEEKQSDSKLKRKQTSVKGKIANKNKEYSLANEDGPNNDLPDNDKSNVLDETANPLKSKAKKSVKNMDDDFNEIQVVNGDDEPNGDLSH